MGCAGFDFVVVDMEHTPLDPPQMVDVLRAVAGTAASALTRVPWNDVVMVKRALDAGAQSLLFPFVQNAAEAARAVAATRYPPQGVRGVAGTHRGARYGTIPDYVRSAGRELCVVVQVETDSAVDALPQIAAVEGVDSVFVGPSDLAASMGHLGDPAHDAVQARIAYAAQRCRELGKPAGILAMNPETAARYLGYGYTWIAISSDMALMVGRAQEYLGRVRADFGATRSGSATR
jgi:2-dehydro-3-deoxyglucarate aldolase/4-hydroxy-2-oxoheptanedioate aldolase